MDPYPRPQYQPRPQKDYLAESLLTLLLYYLGFGIIGFVANLIFLGNANRDERQGIDVSNKGCLQILLWVHVIGFVIGCVVLVIILALGGFGTLIAILQGNA